MLKACREAALLDTRLAVAFLPAQSLDMRIVNTAKIEEEIWQSPKGSFAGVYKGISLALGRNPSSSDLRERHPFDLELCKIPPGKKNFPYHAHSAQTELYLIVSGTGVVRDETGLTSVRPGDAILFHPGEAHQIINDSDADLILYVIADNPLGESCYYPDSRKWSVPIPEKRYVRSDALSYEDGEE